MPPAPRPRDADRSRARILAAATREFARHGYGGARVDAICRAAQLNARMIYHYFGDKDGLYVAVLERVLDDLRREELKLVVDETPPLQGVLELFDFMYGHFGAHPELINLMSGENVLGARFLRRSAKIPLVASPLIALLRALLRRGERDGVFRRGIDPLRLYVRMVALCYFHRSNAHTLSNIFRTDLRSADWQARYLDEARAMLRASLAPDPPRPRATATKRTAKRLGGR
jgi:AcrR family transcriptional regulator